MKKILALLMFAAATSVLNADEFQPSPKETFTIVQRGVDAGDGTKGWSAGIIFPEGGAAETPLIDAEMAIPWPSVFHVSPDDQWIMQVQKIGSGQNIAFLFKVEANQRVTRMAQPLQDFAWKALADAEELPISAYNEVGVEFVAWEGGILKIKIKGFRQGELDEDIERMVTYDLAANKYRALPLARD